MNSFDSSKHDSIEMIKLRYVKKITLIMLQPFE